MKNLEELGYKVAFGEFPRYDTYMGKAIKGALYGEFAVEAVQFAKMYELDRYYAQNQFDEYEKDGVDYLVLDRYTMSNTVFMTAKGLSPIDVVWLQHGLRQADLHIVVDITVEESLRRGQAYETLDNNERDTTLLNKVRSLQLEYAEEGTYYGTGAVVSVNGQQESKDVADDILKVVLKELAI